MKKREGETKRYGPRAVDDGCVLEMESGLMFHMKLNCLIISWKLLRFGLGWLAADGCLTD